DHRPDAVVPQHPLEPRPAELPAAVEDAVLHHAEVPQVGLLVRRVEQRNRDHEQDRGRPQKHPAGVWHSEPPFRASDARAENSTTAGRPEKGGSAGFVRRPTPSATAQSDPAAASATRPSPSGRPTRRPAPAPAARGPRGSAGTPSTATTAGTTGRTPRRGRRARTAPRSTPPPRGRSGARGSSATATR